MVFTKEHGEIFHGYSLTEGNLLVEDISYHPGKNGSSEIILSFLAFGPSPIFRGFCLLLDFGECDSTQRVNFRDAISWSVEIVFENVWWWKVHQNW